MLRKLVLRGGLNDDALETGIKFSKKTTLCSVPLLAQTKKRVEIPIRSINRFHYQNPAIARKNLKKSPAAGMQTYLSIDTSIIGRKPYIQPTPQTAKTLTPWIVVIFFLAWHFHFTLCSWRQTAPLSKPTKPNASKQAHVPSPIVI